MVQPFLNPDLTPFFEIIINWSITKEKTNFLRRTKIQNQINQTFGSFVFEFPKKSKLGWEEGALVRDFILAENCNSSRCEPRQNFLLQNELLNFTRFRSEILTGKKQDTRKEFLWILGNPKNPWGMSYLWIFVIMRSQLWDDKEHQ